MKNNNLGSNPQDLVKKHMENFKAMQNLLFGDFESLKNQMNVFEQDITNSPSFILDMSGQCSDVFWDSEFYYYQIDLPGVKRQNIIIEHDQTQELNPTVIFSISWERTIDRVQNIQKKTGNCSFNVKLGDIELDKIQTTLADGVLTIKMPIKKQITLELKQKRRLEIN